MKKTLLLLMLSANLLLSCESKKNKVEVIKTTSRASLYEVKVANRCGLIDSTGKMVVNPQFDDIYLPFNDNSYDLLAVRLGTKIGFIDRTGQYKINPQYDIDTTSMDYWFGTAFSEGLANVKINNQYCFIDTTGKIVITPKCEECSGFSEGLALIKLAGKWGYIDKTGKTIIEPQFDRAHDFHGGVAEIGKFTEGDNDYASLTGFVNKQGKVIWQPTK